MAQIDFESLLKQTTGLDSASVGSAAIERAVRFRMASVGAQLKEDYWQQLQDSKAELQELVEAVVVPETWFFRDEEAFAALVRLVAAEWRPSASTSVRLLSVPCSTGEEPYSMVMALLDAGFAPDQIQVDAIDISGRALARAKRAHYGSNSFRGKSLLFRERYFRPTADGYTLLDSVREKVTFRQGNLLADDLRLNETLYDVVFCRNVMIYFDRATQEQAIKKLGRFLTPSGFLFVGPAEAFIASCNGFASVNHTMSFAFRRSSTKDPSQPARGFLPKASPPKIHVHVPRQRPVRTMSLPVAAPTVSIPETGDLHAARRLADSGRLQEALEALDSHLRRHGPSAEVYYLLGLVRDAMGSRAEAADSYRKALYLEPDHVDALTHLALLLDAQGQAASAGRLRERARRAERALECAKTVT